MDLRGWPSKMAPMCALVLLFRFLEDSPVFVAANRDEAYDRPSSPPGLLVGDAHRSLAPRDRRSGGTWIGFNDAGVFAAITNRPGDFDPLRPSRGELVPLALDQATAEDASKAIAARVAEGRENPFRLVVADASTAWLVSDDAKPAQLAPGAHLLTNEHGLNAFTVPALEQIRAAQTIAEAEAAAREVLADHAAHEGAHRFCKHGQGRGTVSSSLVWIPNEGVDAAEFLYAAGPPCRVPYQRYSNLVKRLKTGEE
ncbi:MAG TPA: NRDE family protein [Planctomycetota bacterium]|nr:NRDE family protein [Planctomycetota bacterium]